MILSIFIRVCQKTELIVFWLNYDRKRHFPTPILTENHGEKKKFIAINSSVLSFKLFLRLPDASAVLLFKPAGDSLG